jgi:hypothetical protein
LFPLCCLCFPAVCWLGCFFSTFFPAQVAWRRRGGLGVGSQMGCLGVCDIIYIYIKSIRYRYNLGSSFFPYLGSYFF